MDQNERFVYNEVEDDETTKQSPQSSQTWPMDKIRKSRFQLLSPVTPKRNYSVSHSKSLLLQCLRDSKTDPPPRSRRFPASSYSSDEGILMDGVLVTSATTAKKKVSDSSPRSSVIKNLHKNTEFSTPRNETGPNQETIQQSSAGKENSPSTKLETPTKAATNPSKLKATAEPFTLTPRSQQRPVSTLPWTNQPPRYAYPRPLHGPPRLYFPPQASPYMPDLCETNSLTTKLPSPTGYQMHQSPARNDLRISLLPTTNTSEPVVQTHGSRLDSSLSVDGLDLSSLSDELDTMKQTQDLSLSPSSAGLETMKTKKEDWSPCDDGLETLTEAQIEFTNSHDRILPDDAFECCRYRKRLPVFTQLTQT